MGGLSSRQQYQLAEARLWRVALVCGLILGFPGSTLVFAEAAALSGVSTKSLDVSVSEESFTLKKCLREVLINNALLTESQLGVEAAGKDVQSAKGKYYPRISLEASLTRRGNPAPYIPAQSATVPAHFSDSYGSWGPTLTIPLYQGGQISRNVDLSRLRQNIQEDMLSLTRNELIANTVNSYHKLLQIQSLRKASQASVAALEEERKNVQQLYDVKRVARVDLLKVEVQLANERQRLLSLNEAWSTIAATLRSLMGASAQGIIAPLMLADSLTQESGPVVSFDDAIQLAHEQRPEYLIALKGVQEAKLNKENAFGKMQPSVNALASYMNQDGFNPTYNQSDWFVGFGVSLPIFDRPLYIELDKQRILYEKAKQHLQVVEDKIALEIQVSLLSLAESRERITTAEQVIEQAKESFRIEQLRYKTGAGSMSDTLLAQAAYMTAAANYAQALFDYNTALVGYRTATGTMKEYLK